MRRGRETITTGSSRVASLIESSFEQIAIISRDVSPVAITAAKA